MRSLAIALLTSLLGLSCPAWADVPSDSRQAAEDILFDMDIENASYSVRSDGYIDITFGKSLSDEQYRAAIERLKAHPSIPGILAGRGSSDYCPVP